MIHIHLDIRNTRFHSLKISGHEIKKSQLALVCNSVSILGQNFAESLLVLTPKSKYSLKSNSGLLEITALSHSKESFLTCEILLKSFLIGVEKIKRIHTDEIKLNISTSS
ncbi:MAG: hypothetical protein COB02_03530 [Candidatus Cloacimonadota bacterium]|nr:MAG: hypothetical protein COB02_03530 [Candidatus Cloacimonadota bacterium]